MANYQSQVGSHLAGDAAQSATFVATTQIPTFTYTFENFFHPYVGRLIRKLNRESLAGLLDADYHKELAKSFFTDYYGLEADAPDDVKYFDKEIELDGGPYSGYNWELLFHIPLTIAVHLSKNQRFAEAQTWFHYIFDPTSNDGQYWKFLKFRDDGDPTQIDDLLELLSTPDDELDENELALKGTILESYQAIQDYPFQPHRVARVPGRTAAYQYCVVMKYLDNLIAWGDSLFLQDTIETINEATLCYVQASNLLGPRPEEVPAPGNVRPKTFADLKAAGLDALGNAFVDLEVEFPFSSGPQPGPADPNADPAGSLFGTVPTLYFCIPPNQKLLSYWDTVEDRLYKIRHCMNIEGVVRQLALFDPPIDPGMLVKAAAAGIDIGSIVSGLNASIGPVRCTLLLQKALELAGEVRSLGGALLSALEKRDGEKLALLRQAHEVKMQELAQEVRFLQWKQAKASTDALLRTRASALERYAAYLRLLGLKPDGKVAPEKLPLDRRALTEENFDDAFAELVAKYDKTIPVQPFPKLKLAGDAAPAALAGASGMGNLYLNQSEDDDLNQKGPMVRDYQTTAWGLRQAAPTLALLPDFPVNLHFWGLGGTIVFGGTGLSKNAVTAAEIVEMLATRAGHDGAMAAKRGSFERRVDDWILQGNLAARELMQIGRQILTSLVAEQVAHHEYLNAKKQVAHAESVQTFLQDKFTSRELYHWMQGELSRLYYDYYRFAFDTARKAERTMKAELMRPELDATDYVKFNYWDGGRKGLLSGEALHQDLKRLEMAYHENNKREFEITRHVSLRQLDPVALLTLRATGTCEVTIPEWLYDRDCPGHYLRRLKSVSLSIPAVVGPYGSLNCTLSLLRSSVRTSPLFEDGYVRSPDEEDSRFVDYFGAVEQIVTSGGANDAGLFEANLKDERYLPFEGRGAISTWRLELPSQFRPFDYATISDVVLHVRYTARQGGTALGSQALTEMRDVLAEADTSDLALLFSLRHEQATEWAAFVNGTGDFQMALRKDAFPYMVQGEAFLTLQRLEIYALRAGKLEKQVVAADANALTAQSDALNDAAGEAALVIARSAIVDLLGGGATALTSASALVWLVVRYSL
jgi:hypothetical protein